MINRYIGATRIEILVLSLFSAFLGAYQLLKGREFVLRWARRFYVPYDMTPEYRRRIGAGLLLLAVGSDIYAIWTVTLRPVPPLDRGPALIAAALFWTVGLALILIGRRYPAIDPAQAKRLQRRNALLIAAVGLMLNWGVLAWALLQTP